MKHVSLDKADESVRQFILSLHIDSDGTVLELDGREIAHVTSIPNYDRDKLTAAILSRRDESRSLNEDWAAVDAEHEMGSGLDL